MRLAALALVAFAAGCSWVAVGRYPVTDPLLDSLPLVLVEGQAVRVRGVIRGAAPARALTVELRDPRARSCAAPPCGVLWAETVELPPGELPQPVDVTVRLAPDLVDERRDMELWLIGRGEEGAAGRSRGVVVLPGDG